MFGRIICPLLACFFLSLSSGPAGAIDDLQQQNRQIINKEIAVQIDVDKWSAEKQALVSELLDQKTQLDWNRFQNKKYQQYLAHKQQNIADLKHQKEVMGKLRMELEPFLDSSIENLTAMIAADLPFLADERQERLTFVSQSLADPDLKLSEKLRRLLEAVQVEADYGNNVEVTEEKLNLESEESIVQVLRLGRIGLFYLTLDNKNVGRWDRQQQRWAPIATDYAPVIQTTISVVQQKRVAELVDLPVPKLSQADGEMKR
mgnify:CR=1 FL=1